MFKKDSESEPKQNVILHTRETHDRPQIHTYTHSVGNRQQYNSLERQSFNTTGS